MILDDVYKELWFDVEWRYNTTLYLTDIDYFQGCGLM